MNFVQVAIVLIVSVQLVNAGFSAGFQSFLVNLYGNTIATQLARADMGPQGSFGGGSSSRHLPLNHDPFIIMHGLNSYALSSVNVSSFFAAKGFNTQAMFATSYGRNGTFISINDELKCDYVKQVRRLILAVHKYTGRKVVYGGYSMGSTIGKKAILGGNCVDTGEYLGKPLTNIISKYISSEGANYGHAGCYSPVYSNTLICNNLTGLFPYVSQFIQDINSKQHYEGKNTYAIRSLTDDTVLYPQTLLQAADVNITVSGFTHNNAVYHVLNSQYYLVTTGRVAQAQLNVDLEAESLSSGNNCTGSIEASPRHHHH